MPRTISIHPISLVVGLLLAALMFVTMSQSSLQGPMPLRVEYTAHPRDMVQIDGTAPYTVPSGKILCLTAVGAAYGQLPANSNGIVVSVNGQQRGSVGPLVGAASIPTGVTASAGSVVDVGVVIWNQTTGQWDPPKPYPPAHAWGYLANQ